MSFRTLWYPGDNVGKRGEMTMYTRGLASVATIGVVFVLVASVNTEGATDGRLSTIVESCRERESVLDSCTVKWNCAYKRPGEDTPYRVSEEVWTRFGQLYRMSATATTATNNGNGEILEAYEYAFDGKLCYAAWPAMAVGRIRKGHDEKSYAEAFDTGTTILLLQDPVLKRPYSDLLQGRPAWAGTRRLQVEVQEVRAVEIDGETYDVVEVMFGLSAQRKVERLTLYFSPSHGNAISKCEHAFLKPDGWMTSSVVTVVEWAKIGGVFLPAALEKHLTKTDVTAAYANIVVDRPESYAEDYFKLTFRPGTLVFDEVAGIQYKAGGSPIEDAIDELVLEDDVDKEDSLGARVANAPVAGKNAGMPQAIPEQLEGDSAGLKMLFVVVPSALVLGIVVIVARNLWKRKLRTSHRQDHD